MSSKHLNNTKRRSSFAKILAALSGAAIFVFATANPVLALEEGKLLVWINGDKGYTGLQEIGNKFKEATGVEVVVEHPEGVTDKFQQAASSGKGPDIFFWAHDRFGEWAAGGLLEALEIDGDFKATIDDKGWDAVTINGSTWGIPVAFEAVGLIYNTDKVKTPPTSLEQIIANPAEYGADQPLFWDYNNTYFTWGILAGGGAYVFAQDDAGAFDTSKTGVNDPGSIEALGVIKSMIDKGVIPAGVDYAVMESKMTKGEASMMINGPWSWENLRKNNINFAVAPVPGAKEGQNGSPFIGVLAATINKASPNKELALAFLKEYVVTDDGLKTIDDDVAIGVPALKSFYEVKKSDPLIEATMANVQAGKPMPGVPEMGKFWSSMGPALSNVTSGQASPEDALNSAAKNMTAASEE